MYKKSWLHSWLINPNAWKHSVIFSSWVYKAKGWIWIWKVSFLKEHFSSSRALKIFKLNWFRWRPWQARICWVKLEQGQNSASCQAEKKKICHCLAGAGCVGRFWWQKKNPKSSVVDGAPEIPEVPNVPENPGGCQVKTSESGRALSAILDSPAVTPGF